MKKNRSFFLYKIIISSILFRSTTNVARDESKWLELVGTSCWMLLVAAKTKNLQNFNLSFEKGLTLKQKVGHYHVQNWKFSRLEEHRWFFCSIRNLDFRCIWFLSFYLICEIIVKFQAPLSKLANLSSKLWADVWKIVEFWPTPFIKNLL